MVSEEHSSIFFVAVVRPLYFLIAALTWPCPLAFASLPFCLDICMLWLHRIVARNGYSQPMGLSTNGTFQVRLSPVRAFKTQSQPRLSYWYVLSQHLQFIRTNIPSLKVQAHNNTVGQNARAEPETRSLTSPYGR